MNRSRVVGVGCFGRPQTFSGFIRKILRCYSPGPADLMALHQKPDPLADGSAGFNTADDYAAPRERAADLQPKANRIAGFYVSCIDDSRRFSVFACISGKK